MKVFDCDSTGGTGVAKSGSHRIDTLYGSSPSYGQNTKSACTVGIVSRDDSLETAAGNLLSLDVSIAAMYQEIILCISPLLIMVVASSYKVNFLFGGGHLPSPFVIRRDDVKFGHWMLLIPLVHDRGVDGGCKRRKILWLIGRNETLDDNSKSLGARMTVVANENVVW